LAVHLTADEEVQRIQPQTDNPQSYEAFLRGWEHYRRDTADHYVKAMEYFRQASDLDPEYGRAYAAMASTYWKSFRDEFYDLFRIGRTEARERAQRLLERALQEPTSLAYQVASEISLWWHKHDEAIGNGEKAIALDPNSTGGRVVLAQALIFSGRPEEALVLIDSAEQLDPTGKARYEFVRGLALFGMEQYGNAAKSLERARELNPEDWAADNLSEAPYCLPCQVLLSTYGYLARTDDANSLLAYIRAYYADFTIQYTPQDWPYKLTEDAARLDEGLRRVGVPE
jgi:tetratricopeptide (TPR) repeat protein